MKTYINLSVAIFIQLIITAFAEDKLYNIQNEIIQLQSSISDSEKQIRAKNLEYKTVLSELSIYDEKFKVLQHTLFEYKQKVKIDYKKIQKSWNLLIMQQADSKRQAEYLITHRQIMDDMKVKVKSLKNNISWATKLESDLEVTMKSSEQVKMKADLLLSLIRNLEDNKLSLVGKIHQRKSSEVEVEAKNINSLLEKKVSNGDFIIGQNFSMPINKFNRFERSEHGVNFYYNSDAFLLAPAHGKVIYVGELSNYGNVIMIEHNQKMISVLLGDMRSDVEESAIVSKGSVIGKLIADRDGANKSLYYEIRNEEKPVPALSYLNLKK